MNELRVSHEEEPYVEVKLSYVQGLIESAVSQAAALMYVKNALNAGFQMIIFCRCLMARSIGETLQILLN